MRVKLFCLGLLCSFFCKGQEKLTKLTVEKIMRDPKWIGTSPSAPYWSIDNKTVYFSWNPEQKLGDSLYSVTLTNISPQKYPAQQQLKIIPAASVIYNASRTAYVYARAGDIFCTEIKSGK